MHDNVSIKPGEQPSSLRICMTSTNICNNPLNQGKQSETCRLVENVSMKTKTEKVDSEKLNLLFW